MKNQHTCCTKSQRCKQRNSAMQVQRKVAVIPPHGVKTFFKNVGRHILNQCRSQGPSKEYSPERNCCPCHPGPFTQHPEKQVSEDNTASINRAHRAKKESPVLSVMFSDRAENAFINPSKKAENNKLIDIVRQHLSHSPDENNSIFYRILATGGITVSDFTRMLAITGIESGLFQVSLPDVGVLASSSKTSNPSVI